MKKITYFLVAVSLAILSGCQDDVIEDPVIPAQTGDEITFGPSLDKLQTRTIYDDVPVGGAYRVRWEEGDQVAIYCPQSSGPTLVKYAITPDKNDSTTSSAVTKVNMGEAGLQWGTDDVHKFYGFYPAGTVTGTEDGKIRGHVPTLQSVESWNIQRNAAGGQTYYGKTNTDLSYMWAYGGFNKSTMGGEDVPLTFHPWMTVLEIKVPGPISGSLTVSNINIVATEGTQTMLAGDFVCDMTAVEEGGNAPNYEPVNDQEEVDNTISISTYRDGSFVTLESPNDTLVVRAYLLPIDDQNTVNARNIMIRVATLDGGAALTRTLGYSNHGENSIQPHKVNTVVLPNVINTGTNYWMSSLPSDVYLSEVSLPGSKFSYLTEANAGSKAAFQGKDIEQQFLDGVRAFIVQVGAEATYTATRQGSWPFYYYTYEYSAGNSARLPIFSGGGDNLTDAISKISTALQNAETELKTQNLECAVVMLTYAGDANVTANYTGDRSGSESDGSISVTGGAEKVWMDVLADVLENNPSLGDRIYRDEITANTTLEDVKGKIILKVNTNSDAQGGYLDAAAEVPALFSRWNDAKNTVPLRWGTPNPNSTRPILWWMYQEATHVGNATEITASDKISYIEDVFTESVTAYQNNSAHNTWFMNDCGGTFHGTVSGAGSYSGNYGDGDTNDENPIALARWVNPQVTRFLQERTENASTGLVFFNFADKQDDSGALYGTDNLIQTIIDNNFKFNLRRSGNTTTTRTVTRTAGNGWDE